MASSPDQSDCIAAFRRAAEEAIPTGCQDDDQTIAELMRDLGGHSDAIEPAAIAARTRAAESIVAALSPVEATRHAHDGALGRLLELGRRMYEMTTGQERLAWTALALFPDTFVLEQAAHVLIACGVDHPEQVLGSLVARQVVDRGTDDDGLHFRLPVLYRTPAAVALTADEALSARARRGLRAWWLELARDFYARWFGPALTTLVARVDKHLPDLEPLLAGTSDDDAGEFAEIVSLLVNFWSASARIELGISYLEMALHIGQPTPVHRFGVLVCLAWLTSSFDADRAEAAVIEAAALELDSPEADARLSQIRGLTALYRGEANAAAQHCQDALDYDLSVTAESDVLFDLSFMAAARSLLGDQHVAYGMCQSAIAICERHGEVWLKNFVLWAFALTAWRDGDKHRAYVLALDGVDAATEINDRFAGAISLELIAWYEAELGDAVLAARLIGVVEALRIEIKTPTLFWGIDVCHDVALRTAIARLGPQAFWRSSRDGRRHGLADAARWLQAEPAPHASGRGASPSPSGALTPRQCEIAGLIAQGRSNKEIARLLLITVRTVETHIEHIFRKLDVVSRAQIAVWVVRQGKSTS